MICDPTVLVTIFGVVIPFIVLAVASLSAPLEFGGMAWGGDFTIRAYERVAFDRDWDGSLVLQQGYVNIFLRLVITHDLMVFSMFAFEVGFVAVLFAHVVFCVPLAYLTINARVKTIDRTLLEAAADLSAPPWAAFRQIIVPLALRGIVAGAPLSFVASMNDYVMSYFLAGAGMTTLPMYIFSALQIGTTPKVSAISTAVIALSSAQLLAVWALGMRGEKRARLNYPKRTNRTSKQ